SNLINERLSVIEKELGNVDSDIAEYKGKNLLPDIEEATKLFMQDASENTKRQVEVGTQVAITQYLIDYLRAPENANKLLPANTGVESPGIQKQIDEYNTQVLKRNRIANASGDSSPMVLELDEALSSIKSAMVASLGNLKSALSTELRSLVRSDEENNRKIASSPTKAKYLLSVERQQKVKEALYLFLLQQREENELSLAFTPSNLRLITPPWGQDKPTSPVSRNVLMICLAAGLLIPAAFIFVSESLDNYVRSRADLEVLHAPFLGEVPEANTGGAGLKRFKRRWRNIMGKASAIETAPELFVHAHGRSIINESFRMLRSNVEFVTRVGSSANVVMVTSFNPGSGKSFISLNLAAAFAVKKKDQRVLIIDLDLRRASVSRVVGNSQRGISDYLSEAADDVAPMIRPTKCDGIYILPVGTIP
ncbi:MAG: chromosome partitioning protein ParA, partial [Duncaniella sp.]|nr:chromosome partitioning protein ParA [Duncaniella sp.]